MPIEFSDEAWAEFSPKQRETLLFVEQLNGATITDAPPPADSALGRMSAMTRAKEGGLITEEECADAYRRIMRESLAEAIRNGDEPF
jgi:hypothetical protein